MALFSMDTVLKSTALENAKDSAISEKDLFEGMKGFTGTMSKDLRNELLSRILAAHESFYDIRRDYLFEGHRFPAFAEFHTYGEKYVLTKRAKLWEVNTHDFMFFEIADELDEALLEDALQLITTKAIRKVDAGPNHMSSALTLIIIANRCTEEVFKRVKSTRFRKNYRFGLRGWTDLRLAVVDLSREADKEVTTNAAGKQLKQSLASNLALARNVSD